MLYSISETARLLKVSVSLIKVKIKEGVITPKEIIGNKGTRYFTREEIERNALEYARERQFERESRLEAYKRSTSSIVPKKTLFSSFKKLCSAVL